MPAWQGWHEPRRTCWPAVSRRLIRGAPFWSSLLTSVQCGPGRPPPRSFWSGFFVPGFSCSSGDAGRVGAANRTLAVLAGGGGPPGLS